MTWWTMKGLYPLLKNAPRLADACAEIEEERAVAPQDRSERLISDDDHGRRIIRIKEAELALRAKEQSI